MRGPSSSHTAGAYHIGTLARSLLSNEPILARFTFDPEGSYGRVYNQQGADLSFAAALMGWPITDERFPGALDIAAERGMKIQFVLEPIDGADHPNSVGIYLKSEDGSELNAVAKSTGGGSVELTKLDEWTVSVDGTTHSLLIEVESESLQSTQSVLEEDAEISGTANQQTHEDLILLSARLLSPLPPASIRKLEELPGTGRIWTAEPLFFVQRGDPLFKSGEEMVSLAAERGISLGHLALEYESVLLGLSERDVMEEMVRRFGIMSSSVHAGLQTNLPSLQLLEPSAGTIMEAERGGTLATGGLHTRVAARAMSVMHINGGMGVVCAAPTAGAAGVLPAIATTLVEEKGLKPEEVALALMASGAIGIITATRATFAAEVAGCQVEIGAAGAMAAAAIVEAAGGSARQAVDAAAISYQNSMGSVCDLVQGIVEIPCHTRNAVAASNAFICADLVLGGYRNPIPLDETIDAVYAVGKMLPPELRCTALGGLAVTPVALSLEPRLPGRGEHED